MSDGQARRKQTTQYQTVTLRRPTLAKVAIDLVGPMPMTQGGNQWILVFSDQFTCWQVAIPLADVTAPAVATALNEKIFCHFGLPEQLHFDPGKLFQSQLMAELCSLGRVDQTHTAPYHLQPDQRSSREEQQRAGRHTQGSFTRQRTRRLEFGTSQASTGETANMLMLGRELRLPDLLMGSPPPSDQQEHSEHVPKMVERLEKVHTLLREQQLVVRQNDGEEPPLFQAGDQEKKRREAQIATKFHRTI